MRYPEQPPSYTRFVFTTALISGIGIFLWIVCWVALLTVMIGGFVPSLDELQAVGTYYLATAAYGIVLFFEIYIQNERWIELYRQPKERPELRQAPRPIANTFQAMAHNSKTYTVGVRSLLPPTVEHYAALYHKLQRNNWRITRRNINVKVGNVPAFTALTERYGEIIRHWESMGWVEDNLLTEAGQAHFAELGHVQA